MILVHIAIIIVVLDPMQFIRWFAPSWVCTNVVLNSIVYKVLVLYNLYKNRYE